MVFGSLAGEFVGIRGWVGKTWAWFGNQGFEYLDLGRFWQILLTQLSQFGRFEAAKPFRISKGFPKVFTTAKAG